MSLVKQRDVEAAKKKMDKKSAKTNKKRRKYKKSDKILSSMIKELIGVEKSVVEEGKYRIKMKFKTGEIDWVESSAVHHKAKTTKMFNAFVEKITQGQFKSWGKFEEKLQQVPMMQAGLNIQFQFAKDEVPEQHLFTFMYRYKEGLPPGYLADICWDKCDNPSYDISQLGSIAYQCTVKGKKTGWEYVHPKDPVLIPKHYFEVHKSNKNKKKKKRNTRAMCTMNIVFFSKKELKDNKLPHIERAQERAKSKHQPTKNRSRYNKAPVPPRHDTLMSSVNGRDDRAVSSSGPSVAVREEKMSYMDLLNEFGLDTSEASDGQWTVHSEPPDVDDEDDVAHEDDIGHEHDIGHDDDAGHEDDMKATTTEHEIRDKEEAEAFDFDFDPGSHGYDDDDDEVEILSNTKKVKYTESPTSSAPRSSSNSNNSIRTTDNVFGEPTLKHRIAHDGTDNIKKKRRLDVAGKAAYDPRTTKSITSIPSRPNKTAISRPITNDIRSRPLPQTTKPKMASQLPSTPVGCHLTAMEQELHKGLRDISTSAMPDWDIQSMTNSQVMRTLMILHNEKVHVATQGLMISQAYQRVTQQLHDFKLSSEMVQQSLQEKIHQLEARRSPSVSASDEHILSDDDDDSPLPRLPSSGSGPDIPPAISSRSASTSSAWTVSEKPVQDQDIRRARHSYTQSTIRLDLEALYFLEHNPGADDSVLYAKGIIRRKYGALVSLKRCWKLLQSKGIELRIRDADCNRGSFYRRHGISITDIQRRKVEVDVSLYEPKWSRLVVDPMSDYRPIHRDSFEE